MVAELAYLKENNKNNIRANFFISCTFEIHFQLLRFGDQDIKVFPISIK